MSNEYTQLAMVIFGIVMLLGLLVQSVMLWRSIPQANAAEKEVQRQETLRIVRQVLSELRTEANKTVSPTDNLLLDKADSFVDFVDKETSPAPTPLHNPADNRS